MMKTYQIQLPSGENFEVLAITDRDARLAARFYCGTEKLPKGTLVVRV